jgi:hypothetical protein
MIEQSNSVPEERSESKHPDERPPKKILFCVSYLVLDRGEWDARFEYTHATNPAYVYHQFVRSLPKDRRLGINVSITAIGPALGGFENEETGERML